MTRDEIMTAVAIGVITVLAVFAIVKVDRVKEKTKTVQVKKTEAKAEAAETSKGPFVKIAGKVTDEWETSSVSAEDLPDWFGKHGDVTIQAVATSEKPKQMVLLVKGRKREPVSMEDEVETKP
jgi:hypothetical protein